MKIVQNRQEAWEKVESGEDLPKYTQKRQKRRDIIQTYLNTGVGFVKL